MSESTLASATEELAYLAITRLQAEYADAVTRRAWSEFDDLFDPDATVDINKVTEGSFQLVGPHAIAEFIAKAIVRYDFFEFAILNSVVKVESPESATGRVYFVELRQDAENGMWSEAYAVYQDRYVRRDGRWMFRQRHHQTMARTGRGEVFPMPALRF
jgi:SnoaL-like domain